MMVPGVRNSKSGGHVFAHGKTRTLPLLQGQLVSVLSRMVGGDAGTFACTWLNKMIRGKKWTWQEFTALVEANFWFTNEKDWNRKALLSLRQGSTLMDTFITRFNMFQVLAEYPEDQLIELLEQNTNQQIVKRLILEKGHYTSVVDFKKDLKQAGS